MISIYCSALQNRRHSYTARCDSRDEREAGLAAHRSPARECSKVDWEGRPSGRTCQRAASGVGEEPLDGSGGQPRARARIGRMTLRCAQSTHRRLDITGSRRERAAGRIGDGNGLARPCWCRQGALDVDANVDRYAAVGRAHRDVYARLCGDLLGQRQVKRGKGCEQQELHLAEG
jgi:hypothetical protein